MYITYIIYIFKQIYIYVYIRLKIVWEYHFKLGVNSLADITAGQEKRCKSVLWVLKCAWERDESHENVG
jgi:hypothetical protein